MNHAPPRRLRDAVQTGETLPFMGIYDAFSASLAGRHFDALFVSGFGFAASYYGLPDIGFIAWPDMVSLVQRIRAVLPHHHLMVDIDDGYCDTSVACHVVSLLEASGASAVVLEDQQRPRRCGHFDGKQLLDLDEYLEKLDRVLQTRTDLFVVARTDAVEEREVLRRVCAFAEAGADAVLADGLRDFNVLARLRKAVDCPVVFNQIAGGKSPAADLTTLSSFGASLVIYSTPCLFAAQAAIERTMDDLKRTNGFIGRDQQGVDVAACAALLNENMLPVASPDARRAA